MMVNALPHSPHSTRYVITHHVQIVFPLFTTSYNCHRNVSNTIHISPYYVPMCLPISPSSVSACFLPMSHCVSIQCLLSMFSHVSLLCLHVSPSTCFLPRVSLYPFPMSPFNVSLCLLQMFVMHPSMFLPICLLHPFRFPVICLQCILPCLRQSVLNASFTVSFNLSLMHPFMFPPICFLHPFTFPPIFLHCIPLGLQQFVSNTSFHVSSNLSPMHPSMFPLIFNASFPVSYN